MCKITLYQSKYNIYVYCNIVIMLSLIHSRACAHTNTNTHSPVILFSSKLLLNIEIADDTNENLNSSCEWLTVFRFFHSTAVRVQNVCCLFICPSLSVSAAASFRGHFSLPGVRVCVWSVAGWCFSFSAWRPWRSSGMGTLMSCWPQTWPPGVWTSRVWKLWVFGVCLHTHTFKLELFSPTGSTSSRCFCVVVFHFLSSMPIYYYQFICFWCCYVFFLHVAFKLARL